VRPSIGPLAVLVLLVLAAAPANADERPAHEGPAPGPAAPTSGTWLPPAPAAAWPARDAVPARAVLAACAPPCVLRARQRRGPIELRDEWLLAQPRLTLPSTTPDPLDGGAWQVRLAANRGNDFGWTQTRAGELPEGGDRRFLVDGEHQTTEVEVRHGLGGDVDVGVRLPIHWRGAGFLDGFIDDFHALGGFLDNIRSAFVNDLFRVEGRSPTFERFVWDDGVGLGRVELSARWGFARPCTACSWALALIGRLTLPTSTSVYKVGGVDAGLQLVAAYPLLDRLDVYLGIGGTWFSDTHLDGFEYEPVRGMGFVVFEYRPACNWSFFVELTGSTRLINNVALYPDRQIYLNLGGKFDLSRRWQLEIAVTENLESQQSTTDFGVLFGLTGRF
jgi:hypothetical protein